MNKVYIAGGCEYNNSISHHGIKGQKWGERHYQNPDGTLTEEGRKRYASKSPYKIQRSLNKIDESSAKSEARIYNAEKKAWKYSAKGTKYANKHGESEKTTKKLTNLDKKIKKQEEKISNLKDLISKHDKAAWSRISVALEKGYDVTINKGHRYVSLGEDFIKSLGLAAVSGVMSSKSYYVPGNYYKVKKNKSNSAVGNLRIIDDEKRRNS